MILKLLPSQWPFRRPRASATLSLLWLMFGSGPLVAAPSDQVKITSNPSQAADEFGYSVALSGTTMLAGAPRHDESFSNSGAAFVFDLQANGAWTQVKKLAPADLTADDSFGWAVAISDDTAIVGSRSDDDGAMSAGSAYIFQRDHGGPQNWGQITKLHASDPALSDQFGYAVAISGSTAVVGAFAKDGGGGDRAGAVYVFEKDLGGANTWGQATKLTAFDTTGYELFGYSVAISGDSILVGAPADDNFDSKIGAAYAFQRDADAPGGWRQAEKILPSDSMPLNKFGGAVSLANGTAVIGSYWDNTNGNRSGAAYVFDQDDANPDDWTQVAKLTPSDGAAEDWFGISTALSDDIAVVGSWQDDDRGSASGSAYAFRRNAANPNQWNQIVKVVGLDTMSSNYFGNSVAVFDTTAVAGAYGAGLTDTGAGKVYYFSVPEPSAIVLVLWMLVASSILRTRRCIQPGDENLAWLACQ